MNKKKEVKSTIKKKEKSTENISIIDSVIVSEELRNLVEDFINKVDTIPNPFGKATCYFLSFYKKQNDTLLSLEAYISFPKILEKSKSHYESKGIFTINKKKFAIYDNKEALGYNFYNEKQIESLTKFNIDSINKTMNDDREGWTFVPPYITFKLQGCKLKEIDKYYGK